jgi:hypothetical protein
VRRDGKCPVMTLAEADLHDHSPSGRPESIGLSANPSQDSRPNQHSSLSQAPTPNRARPNRRPGIQSRRPGTQTHRRSRHGSRRRCESLHRRGLGRG